MPARGGPGGGATEAGAEAAEAAVKRSIGPQASVRSHVLSLSRCLSSLLFSSILFSSLSSLSSLLSLLLSSPLFSSLLLSSLSSLL